MSDEINSWPLPPSHSSSILHGLCMTLADLVQEEAGGETSRRAFLKMAGIASATELFSNELSHFFGSRMGDDHDLLEAIQDRYLDEDDETAT